MPNPIPIGEWIDTMDEEYLSSFIREGGASVKFAVPPEESRADLIARMRNRCAERGYVVVELSAANLRAHMPQDIFFGMASQLDWRLLARRAILRLAAARDYRTDGVDPSSNVNVFDAIAQTAELETQFVMQRIRPEIQNRVYRNHRMARDFRTAMSHLCLSEENRGGEYAGQGLLDWLTGAARASAVRPFSIYTAINRATARYFIEAALYWIEFAGYAGTVILLDNSRVTVAKNPRDGLRYYTRAMAVDHYELLREFVDGVDRLTSALMVVVASEEFLDTHSPRGYGIYQALRTRVMDDVRDRNLANPVASLVRLA